jgi:hypothetical protein
MQNQMVDAAVRYESPFDGKVYILVIKNALHVPSMDYNLIPPVMMREAGIIVRDTPKIHMEEPTEEDLKPKKDREFKIVFDDIPEDDAEMASMMRQNQLRSMPYWLMKC